MEDESLQAFDEVLVILDRHVVRASSCCAIKYKVKIVNDVISGDLGKCF